MPKTPEIEPVELGEKNELAADFEKLKRILPTILEYSALIAKSKRAMYLAYVAEGFTEAEAVALVVNSTMGT